MKEAADVAITLSGSSSCYAAAAVITAASAEATTAADVAMTACGLSSYYSSAADVATITASAANPDS